MNPARFGILSTQGDGRLVELAAAGHERAFEVLVARYRPALARYCRRMLPAAQVDDVVQQTFLHAWSAVRSGSRIGEVRPWLYAIARNQAISVLRARRPLESFDETEHAPAVEPAVEARATLRTALSELAGMGEDEREALVRTAFGGESHEDVARDLGMSGGAVRQMVYRTRASLRAAATAVVPLPLAHWLAATRGRALPLAQRLPELTAGAGATGAVGVAAKGGAIIAVAGALAGAAPAAITKHHHASSAPAASARVSAVSPPAPREPVVARAAAAPAPPRAKATARPRPAHARARARVATPRGAEARPADARAPSVAAPAAPAPSPARHADEAAPAQHAATSPAAPRAPRPQTTAEPVLRPPTRGPSAVTEPADDRGRASGSDDGAVSGTGGTSGEATSGGGRDDGTATSGGGGQDDGTATTDGGGHGGSSGGGSSGGA